MGPKIDKAKAKEVDRLSKLLDRSCETLNKLKQWAISHGKSADLCNLKVQLEQLNFHYKRCIEYEDMIIEVKDDEEESEAFEYDYEDTFVGTKVHLLQLIDAKSPEPKQLMQGDANQSIVMAAKSVKLPKLSLPKFSEDYAEWLDFKNEFTSMVIEDADLNDVERFRFLKSCLVDGARRTISQMEASKDNFKSAWTSLVERYENKALMFQTHINKIIMMSGINKESSEGIREMLDCVTAHYRALSSLGSKDELAENVLICLMLSKLDTTTAMKWEESTSKDIPTWDGFCAFLEKRSSTLEKIDYNKNQSNRSSAAPSTSRSSNRNRRNHSVFVSTTSDVPRCIKCNSKGHALTSCPQFVALTPPERYRIANRNRICILCLGGKHGSRNCKAAVCERCQKHHHTMLHFENDLPLRSQMSKEVPTQSSKEVSTQKAYVASAEYQDDSAILATAIVNVLDNKGSSIPCRVLLDSCASTNFISERFTQILNVKRHKSISCVGGIGLSSTTSKASCQITIVSRFDKGTRFTINAAILSKIAEAQPTTPIPIKMLAIPSNINLADLFYQPQNVDLLIGAGLFWNLILIGKHFLGENLPIIQETKLGWIIGGPYQPMKKSKETALISVQERESLDRLDEIVKSFWEIESFPSELEMSLKNQQCEDHYALHTIRNDAGVYVVRLPFVKNPSCLGQSKEVATRRFLNLEKRLIKQPDMMKMYSNFINEYKELHHLEEVKDFNFEEPHFFLPHHCVLKMSSSSTKLRVVFDGSCKTSSGISLNDILHSGPKIQDDLFVILLRFRLFRYVLTGDIQKMYRQVLVADADRNFQLILWRTNQDEPIQIFRLCTVTYGTTCGSYLAIKSLNRLASDEGDKFPIGARVIQQNFYVDDMMVGANTTEELLEIQQQTTELLKLGGFSLSKVCSNNEAIISSVDSMHREKFLKIDEHDVIKALGLIWEPSIDVFRYSYNPKHRSEKITKRIVLSEMASLFDPLGLLCPVITLAKIFYQDLWKLKLDWDQELNSDLSASWIQFRMQLEFLGTISISRNVFKGCKPNSKIEIHAFSDASEKAYGACVYLRSTFDDTSPTVRLLCARSRVSPTKTITIARLELMAAKLLADLVCRIKNEVLCDILIDAEYFWTDSLICLCWLNQEPHNWNTFVAHRVTKIQQLTKIDCWRHVPGDVNPADIVSRGEMPLSLSTSSLWFNGPEFLKQPQESWPKIPHLSNDCEERRRAKCAFLSTITQDVTNTMHFSTYFRGVRRTFAYIFKFVKHCRQPLMSKEDRIKILKCGKLKTVYESIVVPTFQEEVDAEIHVIRNIQQAAFPEELVNLNKNRSVPNNSRLKTLAPFVDEDGILRVGGRIKKADLPFDARHQILLPRRHAYSKSLIMYFHHFRTFHSGPQTVLTAIRNRYWILNGLVECRSVIRRCVWCFRLRPKMMTQIMGDLPKDRLAYKNIRPFVISGVDFAGPLSVRHHLRCKVGKKVYIALFVCMSTKAVHLELVVDLSTEAFIRALKRFIADRGMVTKIYSDNATNFLGTSNQLKEVQEMLSTSTEIIKRECNNVCVEWTFIPPRAPNFGGLWEASIKITKRLIKNVIGMVETTVDELQTIIRQVAAIVNSRPLTPISADANDVAPLTPGHFLYGGPPSALPEIPLDIPINRIKLHQHISWTTQQFWKRFQKEYISNLQIRSNWMKRRENVREGMIILLRDDLAPPLMWTLGKIVKVFADDHGNVRVVKVRTHQGEYDRAISGIAPLPIEENQ